jgi:hypothetical protein
MFFQGMFLFVAKSGNHPYEEHCRKSGDHPYEGLAKSGWNPETKHKNISSSLIILLATQRKASI